LVKLDCFGIILVKQDDSKAVKFYQKACDLNDGNGCSNLGLMYEEGKGVKQDDSKAVKFYLTVLCCFIACVILMVIS
jgi:TPR repeat protein